MNKKESCYLCIGCIAFCVVAIPMMLAFSLRPEPYIDTYSDEEPAPTIRRTPLAPPPEDAPTIYRQDGGKPERYEVHFAPVPSVVKNTVPFVVISTVMDAIEVHAIDVEMDAQPMTTGLEVNFSIHVKQTWKCG